MISALVVSLCLAQPVFNVHALGVTGGDDDSNLSAYVVGTTKGSEELLVDAGAFTRGLYVWKLGGADKGTVTERVKVLNDFVRNVSAVLITHSHLDHVSGLMLTAPSWMSAGRKSSLPLFLLPETAAAIQQHIFSSPLWLDLAHTPPKMPAVVLHSLAPGKAITSGGFSVETIPLAHPVPSAAFLISRNGASYLHLGDTGPTDAVWKRAAPLLQEKKLRAIAVEVSFPSSEEKKAIATGHLTPALLVKELSKLTAQSELKAIGEALGDCKVMAIHIKASQYDAVVGELSQLKAAGLPLVIPEQGAGYSF